MRTVIGLGVLVAVVGGVYLLNHLTRSPDGKSLLHVAGELEVPVETARPEQRDIVRTVQAPGEVEAFDEVDISSELVAKILEMPVEEGYWVQQGDLLCRLDNAEYQARVLSADANVARLKAAITQAQADLEKAEMDYNQEKRLIESGATSTETVARFRTTYVGAGAVLEMRRHELVAAEAALQSAREDLAKTVITAPISGVISQRFAKAGEVVITGTMNNPGTRIMVISNLSKMQVRCRVDETDATLVATGQVAHIYLQSDTRRSVPGHVLRVGTKGTKPLGRDVVTFETLVMIDRPTEELTREQENKGTREQAEARQAAQDETSPKPERDTARSAATRTGASSSVGTTSAPAEVAASSPSELAKSSTVPRPMPGMTANVEIEVARRDDALTIPVQAVVYRKRRDLPEELRKQLDEQQAQLDPAARQRVAEYIHVVFSVADGKAWPRLVQTGISDATSVEILEGIRLTDTVVTGPYRSLDQLKSASPVKLMEKPSATPKEPETRTASQPAEENVET